MAPDAAGFYFLEEIDTGIHPARLHLLVQLIEQYSRRGKVQVVATTHSPQLLSMLSKDSRENAYLVYRHEHESDAQLTRIVDIPSAKDVLQEFSLGRLLETGWFENTMDFVTTDAGEK
jgi:predicted ATPase